MPRFNSRMVFVAACFGMLIFGIVMAVLGSVLPSVIEKFELDKADAGTLFTLLTFGMMAGSLVFGPIVDRFGYKLLLIICAAVIVIFFQGIAFAPSTGVLRLSLFFTGVSGGAINGGTNALVSDISDGKRYSRLTYLGVFFGFGAFGVPLLLGTLLDRYTYETLISVVGALITLPLLLFIFLRFPRPKHEKGFPISEGIGLTKEGTLLIIAFILLLQGGMETSMGGWSATYFHEVLEVDSQRSVLYLSLFWLGLMLARTVLGGLLLRYRASRVLRVSMILALMGSLIMLTSNAPAPALFGLILTGIGFAAIFPVILAYVGDLYSKLSGTAFSVVLTISLFGGMTIPYIIGLIADAHGLRTGLSLIPVSITLAFILFWFVHRRIRVAREKNEPVTAFQKLSDSL